MTDATPEPTPPNFTELADGLFAMRDALIRTALALRDHQSTMDTPLRDAAGREAAQLISRAKAGDGSG